MRRSWRERGAEGGGGLTLFLVFVKKDNAVFCDLTGRLLRAVGHPGSGCPGVAGTLHSVHEHLGIVDLPVTERWTIVVVVNAGHDVEEVSGIAILIFGALSDPGDPKHLVLGGQHLTGAGEGRRTLRTFAGTLLGSRFLIDLRGVLL